MKQLILVRHAKSSWDHPDLADHDRPLNKRGEREAPGMAAYLAAQYPRPELIVSSSAARADATSRVMASALAVPRKGIRHEAAIYEASVATLLALVQGLDNGLTRVMLVGHNPGFTGLVNLLSGVGLDNLPTCGVARIGFDVGRWAAVAPGAGRLLSLDRPEELPV